MSLSQMLARVQKLRTLAVGAGEARFAKYANDPVGYLREVRGVRCLSPDQKAVLEYYARTPRCRLLVPSANETGKSFVASGIMSHHYDTQRPSVTLSTAPSQAQVNDILFRELRRLRRGDPDFSPKAPRLQDGDDHMCVGYTAKDATSFQGRHDASVLVIFDEAEGVPPEFWEAAEGFADKIICFYNPTTASSMAAVEERRGSWKIIRMSALSHPNVTEALAGRPAPIPTAVTLEKVLHRLKKWSTILRNSDPPAHGDIEIAGVRYRPGPVAEARVLGIRPSKPVNAVFTADLLYRAKVQQLLLAAYPVQIGCDVARFGDDFTAIHVRKGLCSLHHEAHNGWDTTQIAKRLRELCREYSSEPMDTPCVIDDTGQKAGGVIDQNQGFKFLPMNVSRVSDEPDDYPNLRSQLYFDFELLLNEGLVDVSRLPEDATHDIFEQLLAASYSLDTKARRVVARKQDIKSALNRSPDDADAMLLAYYQYPETLEHHA